MRSSMKKKSVLRKGTRCLRRFVKQFGWRGLGMSLQYLPLELEWAGRPIVHVSLPEGGTVRLRKGTTDKDVFFQVFVIREYDFAGVPQFERLQSTYERALEAGEIPLILDCGANVGLATIWFARIFPRARIYAIEPDRGNFEMLCANVRDYANVVPLHAAIWDRHAENLAIVDPAVPASFYQVSESGESGRNDVRAYTVPEITRMAGSHRILLAKIDIEGGEQALFRSNTDWLGDVDAIAIELHDWLLPGKGSSRNFFAVLARYPFEVTWHHGTMFCVKVPNQETAQPGGAKASSVEAR
jgi:FkbM family methyltransferase